MVLRNKCSFMEVKINTATCVGNNRDRSNKNMIEVGGKNPTASLTDNKNKDAGMNKEDGVACNNQTMDDDMDKGWQKRVY